MKKVIFQRVMFIIFAICAFLNPILDMLPWLRFTMLAAAIFYLSLGWYFTMIKNGGDPLKSELAGFIYSTVFMANFMETSAMPLGTTMVYTAVIMALGLMIYMIIKLKSVRKDMLIQSIALWMISPTPLFT